MIDSNCDVDESCPWFFIGTVLPTGPIDPSLVDLQHLAHDHSTTRATGESTYISIVANPFFLVYN